MTNKAHSTLTGSDLHEPKGVASATSGQVYISNGSGSGVWTDTAATIGASAFTTGDLKPTFKLTADSGWIMCDDGTIGDISSGATTLASATTSSLYTLLWNNFANTEAAVSSGRGASAAADYAAHKTIALPKMLGRVYGVAGAGSGLTSRAMGKTVGSETQTIIQSDLPNVTLDLTGTAQVTTAGAAAIAPNAGSSAIGLGGGVNQVFVTNQYQAAEVNFDTANGNTVSMNGGVGQTNLTTTQPTVFLKMMVKL